MEEELIAASEPTITLEQQEVQSVTSMEADSAYFGSLQQKAESTSLDYWQTLNPASIPYVNPELRYNWKTDFRGEMDVEDPEFKALYDTADIATKKAMLTSRNTSDAVKTAQRRQIFLQSQEAIQQDSLMTQVAMGALPAIMSPSSAIPFGAVFKGAQIANMTSKLQRAIAFGTAGATAGATANVIDEALFDLQGMPTNYLGAAGIGALFGGGLGSLVGALTGPGKRHAAKSLAPENDSFTRDYEQDNSMRIMYDEEGNVKVELEDIGQMKKSVIDRIPFLGDWLKSDVHTVYQGDSTVLRGYMGRLADPTVAKRDSQGNVIPNKETAKNFQKSLDGKANILNQELGQILEEATLDGYKGNRDTLLQETWGTYIKELNNQRTQLASHIKQRIDGMPTKNLDEAGKRALFKKTREATTEFYDNYVPKFEGSTHAVKASESHMRYFQDMLKSGQDLRMKGVTDIHKNRLYLPRTYNHKGIHRGDISQATVRAEIEAGLVNDARNQNLTREQVNKAVDEIVKMIDETSFDLNFLTTSMLVKDLPFEGRLKAQKLYLNESYMPNVLKTDMDDLVGAYHYQMRGRQGLQFAFGDWNPSNIMETIKQEHVDKGMLYNPKEVQAFERVLHDVLGTLRMNQLADTPAWSFTRNIASYNSARLGGGFGGNQAIELTASVMMQGVQAIISGRLLKSFKNTASLLYGGKKTDDSFTNYMIASGYMEESLHTSRINRYGDADSGFNSGWLENKLNWVNDKLMKYNGMRYFLGVMEDYTGGAVVTQLKTGKYNTKRLARWGLTEPQAKSLGAKLKEITKEDSWDLSSLSQSERDSLQLAIVKGVEEIVVQGDSIHLPNWMKAPTPFVKLLTQFMRFPMIAQETLLRRGMTDEQAQLVAGTFGSVLTFVGLKYLREQASINSGLMHEADSKYDYENYTNEDWIRVTGEALNYTAPLGMLTSGFNYGAILTGNNELGREWSSKNGMSALLGPTGGLGEDLIQLMRSGAEGTLGTERDFKRFRSMLPFMNFPLIKEGGDIIIEELGD